MARSYVNKKTFRKNISVCRKVLTNLRKEKQLNCSHKRTNYKINVCKGYTKIIHRTGFHALSRPVLHPFSNNVPNGRFDSRPFALNWTRHASRPRVRRTSTSNNCFLLFDTLSFAFELWLILCKCWHAINLLIPRIRALLLFPWTTGWPRIGMGDFFVMGRFSTFATAEIVCVCVCVCMKVTFADFSLFVLFVRL